MSLVGLLEVLPLAIVMVAGPQLLSAIFLATTERWRRNSAAFVAGAALSISAIVTLAYFVSDGAREQGASSDLIGLVVLALLLVAMVRVYLGRDESEPPAWMSKLTSATPRFSFKLGFLLLGVFPTDLITSVAVGSFLAAEGLPLLDAAGFVALTLFLLALPALAVLTFGARAAAFLPTARDWMNENSWIVNEVVLLFFVAIVVSNIVG
ncbi:GAP family protein [Halorientalis brevis]|uniref:GAP family protein n=1 Tax=Halorientalis brevis TaxID=1126241 RepID=A0ABD6CHN3_9EURY|nr:GAP family protein [Halorientalis brevis]